MDLLDPSGIPVRVVAGVEELPELPRQQPLVLNVGGQVNRANATQRPPREPARIERLGHVVLETASFQRALDWYLDNLGLIVSDFLYWPGQRDRGPAMAFIRCDRGATPADHHTLAMVLGPGRRYVHSAYEVADLDALAAGNEYLREHRYHHSWGIGRHIEGSQIFDYWRDPDGFLVEHFADGDRFDNTVETGWAQMIGQPPRPVGPAGDQGLPGRQHAAAADDPSPGVGAGRPDQRVRPPPRLRPAEGGHVMSINLIRYAAGDGPAWGVVRPRR